MLFLFSVPPLFATTSFCGLTHIELAHGKEKLYFKMDHLPHPFLYTAAPSSSPGQHSKKTNMDSFCSSTGLKQL